MSDAPLLTPATVAAIDDLDLAARLIVEGVRRGAHRSPSHGFTAEFSQHRPYRQGDDLKHLDWKLLARTDRLYSRQFSETTNLNAMLVLDASGSMAFPAGALSKLRYAVVTAAALAYLIIDRGDAAGLMAMSERKLVYLPARGGRSHLRALLSQLARLQPGGDSGLNRAITRSAELLKRRGVMLVLSDFYDATDATFRELRRVARGGHDVSLLQVLSPQEISFAYEGGIEFEDLETGERKHLDAGAAAGSYRSAVGHFLADCRTRALADRHDYVLMPTDTAPERALRSYLIRRARTAPVLARSIAR